MTARAAAARYARALFDVVVKDGDPKQVERELAGFADLARDHSALAHAFANPAIPAPRKRAVVEQLLERAKLTSAVSKLLLLLAERDRLTLLPDVVEAYRSRLLDHLRVVRAEITTAVPLAQDRRTAIERSLAKTTGRQVTLTARVDPSVIGGAVAKVGSVVYDGSVARQLEKLKEKLAEA